MNNTNFQRIINKDVLAKYPDLTAIGLNSYNAYKAYSSGQAISDDVIEQKISNSRAQLLSSHLEFNICVEYLSKLSEKKSKGHDSYILKHTIENEVGSYISNGILIAAAIYLDLKIIRSRYKDSPNALIVVPALIQRGEV